MQRRSFAWRNAPSDLPLRQEHRARRALSRRWAIVALGASALGLLAHCGFPEYSFRAEGGGAAGASSGAAGLAGGAGAGGGAGLGGSAGALAGQSGAAGAGGGPVCPDCEPFVVAVASAPVLSLFGDDTSVFWSEFDFTSGVSAVRSADRRGGSGETKTILTDEIDQGTSLTLLAGDDEALYATNFPQGQVLRVAKAGGSSEVLLDGSNGNVFVFLRKSENFVFGLRFPLPPNPGDFARPPGDVFRVPAGGGSALRLNQNQGQIFDLVGTENDEALLIDEGNNITRVDRDAMSGAFESSQFLPGVGGTPPPFDVLPEGDAYYILTPVSVQRLPRGGGRDQLVSLAGAESSSRFLQVDGDSLYWLRVQGTNTFAELRTVPKAGGEPRTIAPQVLPASLRVRGGVAFWVGLDQVSIMGQRLR